ncbi:MAG: PBSX family phage terminase large subunit [Acidiferrobacterales bacterium]|nr:PBSX family phage terminase large subunit [Acidiferrobacterales bacterium]
MAEKIEVFPAFQEFLQPARFKIAYGGRGSAKTRTFVTLLVTNCLYHGWRIVCFREIMKSIDDSVYAEIVEEINRRGLQEYFEVLQKEIRCPVSGGAFKFDGLHRNQQKIKGYANFDCAFVEEAANVTGDSWKMLIPTLRKDGSEIWVCFNPETPLDATYQMFVSKRHYPDYMDGKRYCISKKINYTENPRFPDELRVDMEIMKERDYTLYQHVYLGMPVAHGDLCIIKMEWIETAIGFDLEASGKRVIGYDVADEGDDDNAIVMAHGSYVYGCEAWNKGDVIESARKVYAMAQSEGAEITYDSIGVGAGSKAEFRQLAQNEYRTITAHGFNAGGAVSRPDSVYKEDKTNKDHFANIKAQAWFTLADRFYNTYRAAVYGDEFPVDQLISIDPDLPHLEELKFELTAPRREYDGNMRVKVESKKDMKKRGIKSPNIADALVMCFVPDQTGGFVNLFGG